MYIYKVFILNKIAFIVKFFIKKKFTEYNFIKEPFATIENLVKLAKKEIAEVGFAEFKSAIISSKGKCIESIKKEPLGSDFNCSSCFKWWRIGDSNS